MKTVFIPIFQGVEARNILRTAIFKTLRERGNIRIVLFVPTQYKKEYFSKEFSGENIVYEVFGNYIPPCWSSIFSFLKFVLLPTETMNIRRRVEFYEQDRYFTYYFQTLLNRLFAGRFFRRIVRWLDWRFVHDNNFKEVFDHYRPDAIFLAHIFGDEESAMLREARWRNIPAIGLINSWDKLTSRCMIRLLPDIMIVHNEIMKREAIEYADMPENKIRVVGIPHYDIFVQRKPSSRDDFYRRVDADPKKRLILYCPLGKRYRNTDAEILEMLIAIKRKKMIPEDTQYMVRFPPNDIVDISRVKDREGIIFIQPGVRFTDSNDRRVDWDMNDADIALFHDTLAHMSLILCYVSSLSIDAAVFDKPIIHVRPRREADEEHTTPEKRIDRDLSYGLTHYQPVFRSGGVRVVQNEGELAAWINKYLENPALDHKGRARIVREQCGTLDGHAGERTAEIILDALKAV